MFERKELVDIFYERVVKASYKKSTRAYANPYGHSRKIEENPPHQKTNPRWVNTPESAKKGT